MKKAILSILCAISATMAMAQANPKSGYIITNNGDTIRGIIDFRTNERLSTQCDFWANGETEGKNYKPGEIEGFRFDDNGKYFVTRDDSSLIAFIIPKKDFAGFHIDE